MWTHEHRNGSMRIIFGKCISDASRNNILTISILVLWMLPLWCWHYKNKWCRHKMHEISSIWLWVPYLYWPWTIKRFLVEWTMDMGFNIYPYRRALNIFWFRLCCEYVTFLALWHILLQYIVKPIWTLAITEDCWHFWCNFFFI